MPAPIRIAIIGDHLVDLAGLAQALRSSGGMLVVAQGQSLDDAMHIASEHAADVLLLDVAMPGSGINAARCIAAAHPRARIIMLSGQDDEPLVARAIIAGAAGYVMKGASRAEVCEAIRAVGKGEEYISARLATRYALHFLQQHRSRMSSLLG